MATKKKEAVEQIQHEVETQDFRSELGGVLKTAREAQKLTIKDIRSRLHFNENQIIAMEQDNFDVLGDPTRARGFINTYARLLGLDSEELLAKHRRLYPSEKLNSLDVKTETLAMGPQREGIPRYVFVMGLLVLLALIVWFLSTLNFGVSTQEVAPELLAEESMPEVALPASERTEENSAKALVDEIQLPQAQATTAAEPAVSNQKPLANPVSVAPPASTPSSSLTVNKVVASTGNVKFVVTEDTWVDVKDGADKSVFTKLLKPGLDEVIQVSPPIKLHIGNAHGLKLYFNGKLIDYSANVHSNTARVTLGD